MKRPWTEDEKELLRTHYPTGGFLAVRPYLPRRSKPSVNNMAIKLGIQAPPAMACRGENSKYYPPNEAIDELVRAGYREKKSIRSIACRTGRSEGWVKMRALDLGVRLARTKTPRWTGTELEILADCSGRNLATIQRALAKRGYYRSQNAIKVALYSHQIDTTPDNFTAAGLAKLMGVSETAVLGWISKGWLLANKSKRLTVDDSAPLKFWITPADTREFIVSCVAHINFGKCDKYWLVDLLAGAAPDRTRETVAA